MAWTMMEGVVDAVRDYIVNNFPAKVVALNAEYGDAIVLVDLKANYLSPVSLSSIPEFPVLVVLGERSTIEGWIRQGEHLDATHRITVGIMVTDQNVENLQLALYRYARALWELIFDGHASLSGHVVDVTEINFSPLFTSGSLYMGDARLVVSLQKQEAN